MSSLAASRADNFYYPPEWRPEDGSISKFQGSKGANQYEQYGIIRFELPFDGWCLGCKRHMSKGLRFNAKKEKLGKYFSTQIWGFRMKCYSCEQRFLIKTDPENRTYDFAEGLRKMEQDYDPSIEDFSADITGVQSTDNLTIDPINRLQRDFEAKVKNISNQDRLNRLIDKNKADDFEMNSMLRNVNRKRKQEVEKREEAGRKFGLSIPLVDESISDIYEAKSVFLNKSYSDSLKKNTEMKRMKLLDQSIFSPTVCVSKRKKTITINPKEINQIEKNNSHIKSHLTSEIFKNKTKM